MPDDGTHRSVVRGIIRPGIKERRLKNARRKDDLIKAWIVVGIHGWRSHSPLSPVDRLADLVEVPLKLEFIGPITFNT